VDEVLLDGSSIVLNNIASLTTGNGLSSTVANSVGELSLDISGCTNLNLGTLTYP